MAITTKQYDSINGTATTDEASLDVNVKNEEKVKRIADLSKILGDRKQLTKLELEGIAKEDPRYQYIVDNWDKLVGDGKTISRTMLLNIETLVTDDKVLNAYLQAAGTASERSTVEAVNKGYIPKEAANSVRENAAAYFAANPAKLTQLLGGGKTPSGDKTGKQDPYEELLKRLKNVRNAALNAAGGIDELNKALAKSGIKSVKDKYLGIEQQLQSMGYSRQVTDWLTGMDAKEQQNWMRTTTEKFKSGKNKGLVKNPFTGKAMPKGTKLGQVVLSEGKLTGNKKYNAKAFAEGIDAAIIGATAKTNTKQTLISD